MDKRSKDKRSDRFKVIKGPLGWGDNVMEGHWLKSLVSFWPASLCSALLLVTQLNVSQQLPSSRPPFLIFSPVCLLCLPAAASCRQPPKLNERVLNKDIFAHALFSTFFKIPFNRLETAVELLLNQSGHRNLSACSLGAANFSSITLSFHQALDSSQESCVFLFPAAKHVLLHSEVKNSCSCIQWQNKAEKQTNQRKKKKTKPGDQPNCLRHECCHDSSPYFLWPAKTRWQPSGF